MKRKSKLISTLLLLIALIFQTQLIHASSSNFLNIKIEEENKNLTIKEEWNVILKDNNTFEREIALDEMSISNIRIQQKFPTSNALSYLEKYDASKNTTTIETITNSKKDESVVLLLEYKLNLDAKTKSDFINNIPNSLSISNLYGIKKIKLSLNTDEYEYNGHVDFEINENFVQKTSKSKTIEVLIQLFKLFINTIIIGIVCFIAYVGALALYYIIQRNTKQKNQFKKIKSNKKIRAHKRKNLLKTKVY